MSDEKDHYSKNLESQTSKQKEKELLFEKNLNELKTDERFRSFFENYNEQSVQSFINYYATQKTDWVENVRNIRFLEEHKKDEWIILSFKSLGHIQQKKLFDLQCLWRAEKIKLPGIDVCTDFHIWEENIFFCPCLPAITDDEIAFYIHYLEESSLDEIFSRWDCFQHHHDIVDEYKEKKIEPFYYNKY